MGGEITISKSQAPNSKRGARGWRRGYFFPPHRHRDRNRPPHPVPLPHGGEGTSIAGAQKNACNAVFRLLRRPPSNNGSRRPRLPRPSGERAGVRGRNRQADVGIWCLELGISARPIGDSPIQNHVKRCNIKVRVANCTFLLPSGQHGQRSGSAHGSLGNGWVILAIPTAKKRRSGFQPRCVDATGSRLEAAPTRQTPSHQDSI